MNHITKIELKAWWPFFTPPLSTTERQGRVRLLKVPGLYALQKHQDELCPFHAVVLCYYRANPTYYDPKKQQYKIRRVKENVRYFGCVFIDLCAYWRVCMRVCAWTHVCATPFLSRTKPEMSASTSSSDWPRNGAILKGW